MNYYSNYAIVVVWLVQGERGVEVYSCFLLIMIKGIFKT